MGSLCFSVRKQVSDKNDNQNEEKKEDEDKINIKVVRKDRPGRRSSVRHQSLAPSKRGLTFISNLHLKKVNYIQPDEKLSLFLETFKKYSINSSEEEKVLGDFLFHKGILAVISKETRAIITTEALYTTTSDFSDPVVRTPIQNVIAIHTIPDSKQVALRCFTIQLKPEHYKTDHHNQKSIYSFKNDDYEKIALGIVEVYFLKMGTSCPNTEEGHDRVITKKNNDSNKKHLEKYNKFLVEVQKVLNDETFYGVYKVVIKLNSGQQSKRIIVISIACMYFFQGYSTVVIKNKVLIKSVKRVEITKNKLKLRLVLKSKSIIFESRKCEEFVLLIKQINKSLDIKFVEESSFGLKHAKTLERQKPLKHKESPDEKNKKKLQRRVSVNNDMLSNHLKDVPISLNSVFINMTKEDDEAQKKNKSFEKREKSFEKADGSESGRRNSRRSSINSGTRKDQGNVKELDEIETQTTSSKKGNPGSSNEAKGRSYFAPYKSGENNIIPSLKSGIADFTSEDDTENESNLDEDVNSDMSNIYEDLHEGEKEEIDYRNMATDELLRRVREKLEAVASNSSKKSVRIQERVDEADSQLQNTPPIKRKSILKNVTRSNSFNADSSFYRSSVYKENDMIAKVTNI